MLTDIYKGLRVVLKCVDPTYPSFRGTVITDPSNGWCLIYWDDLGRTDSVKVKTVRALAVDTERTS